MHLAHCSPWRNVFFRREDLTCEILTLEPGASDDETLESEASLWTADSSENLNVDSEGATSDFSGVHSRNSLNRIFGGGMHQDKGGEVNGSLMSHVLTCANCASSTERNPASAAAWPQKPEVKRPRRRSLRRQPDSLDSASTASSFSSSSHYLQPSSSATARRFRFHSKSPSMESSPTRAEVPPQPLRCESLDDSLTVEPEGADEERPKFSSRGTFNPEKGKQKLRGPKHSTLRHTREGPGHGRDPNDIAQQLVMYGSNEFMV